MARDWTLNEARYVAVRDLIGAAAATCCHLAALRSDAVLGDAMADEAADWLEQKLSIAAEHVRALHDESAPRWLTMQAADAIRAGLEIVAAKAAEAPAACAEEAIRAGIVAACAEAKPEG